MKDLIYGAVFVCIAAIFASTTTYILCCFCAIESADITKAMMILVSFITVYFVLLINKDNQQIEIFIKEKDSNEVN